MKLIWVPNDFDARQNGMEFLIAKVREAALLLDGVAHEKHAAAELKNVSIRVQELARVLLMDASDALSMAEKSDMEMG